MAVTNYLMSYLLISAVVLVYYASAASKIMVHSDRVVGLLQLGKRYSLSEVDGLANIALACLAQLAFCVAMIVANHLNLTQLGLDSFHPILIPCGIALGIGEMALGSFLGQIALRFAMVAWPGRVPNELKDWLTISRGGWVRELLKTAEIAPLPLSAVLIGSYITVEEVMFRGVLLGVFRPGGDGLALVVTVVLFAIVQTFRMPSLVGAMFPVIGAVEVGAIHGILFLAVPDITPLIVAHVVFFVASII